MLVEASDGLRILVRYFEVFDMGCHKIFTRNFGGIHMATEGLGKRRSVPLDSENRISTDGIKEPYIIWVSRELIHYTERNLRTELNSILLFTLPREGRPCEPKLGAGMFQLRQPSPDVVYA